MIISLQGQYSRKAMLCAFPIFTPFPKPQLLALLGQMTGVDGSSLQLNTIFYIPM